MSRDLVSSFKVMAKNLFGTQINYLVITFKPMDRLVPNLECGKICMVGGFNEHALWLMGLSE